MRLAFHVAVLLPAFTSGLSVALRLPVTLDTATQRLRATPRMGLALEEDDDFTRVAEMVAEAKKQSAAAADAPPPEDTDLLGRVDVDLSLTLHDADAAFIQAEADAVFTVIDTDGSGGISPSELRDHLAGMGLPTPDIRRFFIALDANADGKISRHELRSSFRKYENASLRLALGLATGPRCELAPETGSPNDERAALAIEFFDTIDTNSDGTVDNAELRAHLQGMGYAESTVKAIFGALDLDVNGEISRDEMVACFARSEYAALRLAIAGNDAVKAR